jgi:uncharacterized Ntn-hydrolase superfamily protein
MYCPATPIRTQVAAVTARGARRGVLRSAMLAALLVGAQHGTAAAQAVLPGDEPNGPYPGYWSWPDIVRQVEAYQRDHPGLVRVQAIGRTYEGRDILAVKITKDVHADDEAKPEVLFMAGIHPREQSPQISVMRFMDELITGYGSDERATRLLDTRALWVIPVYNVDGKVHDFKFGNGQTRGANWRVSRELFGPDTFGIDLNRNGLVGWGSASWTPGSGTYHGPGPISAPESKALFDFMATRRFRIFLDIHSTTRAYLMPGPKIREDADLYRYLTLGMQARQREPYRGTVGRNETESGANGGTGVGQTHVTGLYIHGAISYVFELGPANFYAPADSIHAHYERNIREPWYFLLEEAVNLPVRRDGAARLANAPAAAALTPGARVEWRPEVEGDVAYGVLVSRSGDIRVTGEYRLHPLRAGGHVLNVAESAAPGTEVLLQLYLWDRERRRTVVDIPVTVAAPAAREETWPPVATFSILAYDSVTGEVGGAVQSRVFSVGNGVLWAEADVGVVATQAIVDVSYGPQALELLRRGMAPDAVVRQVWENDPDPRPDNWTKQGRQFAVMNARGDLAVFTGPRASEWAGHRTSRHVSAQGNILAGPQVVDSMVAAFERTAGERLALRLVAALEAGQAAGGDRRGMQSAAMLIVRKDGGVWLNNDVVLRLQVDDHTEPIAELRRLVERNARQRGWIRGEARQ